MYIAFKWLVGLTAVMWLSMCIIDIYFINNKKSVRKDIVTSSFEWTNYKNITLQRQVDFPAQNKSFKDKYDQYLIQLLHYTMFFAGAFAVSVYNKKAEIISYTKTTLAKVDLVAIKMVLKKHLKKAAILVSAAMKKIAAQFWGSAASVFTRIKQIRRDLRGNITDKHKKINLLLLQNLREYGEERTKLRQLLIAAIHENKNLRMQNKLESMAKSRLVKHIKDTQNQMKQNRSNYVSYQQLYIVTHQENLFLKARIRKLVQEKEDARKDLMNIFNKVYQSKNQDLIAYCSRIIVKPRTNLLNGDVNAEVRKFLDKSPKSDTAGNWQTICENLDKQVLIQNVSDDAGTMRLVSDAPKLKGLPGECIWTVKDKDGFIEKLYEYDFETNFDSGDVRRIREYSVNFDKDCLLDFSRTRTIVTEMDDFLSPGGYLTNEKFITGSEAFQKFMQNNKNIAPNSRSPRCLLCI